MIQQSSCVHVLVIKHKIWAFFSVNRGEKPKQILILGHKKFWVQGNSQGG